MPYRINPALHRFPEEAAIIGRIVVAFGELEYMAAVCAGKALNNLDLILKTLYRLKSTSARIDAADTLMRPSYADAGLDAEQKLMISFVKHSLGIRNQYAHCNWGDHDAAGLYFTDPAEAAQRSDGFHHYWKHLDVPLLEIQEAYFVHAKSWLFYLEHELPFRRGTSTQNLFPVPTKLLPPPKHNPASQHVPPWLTEDQKARHIKHALEAEQPLRTSRGRKPSAPERGDAATKKKKPLS
jgi:hypothetical protein